MAKVSARGATEVERLRIGNTTYVLRSDGVLLYKTHYSAGGSSGFSVHTKFQGRPMLDALKRSKAAQEVLGS